MTLYRALIACFLIKAVSCMLFRNQLYVSSSCPSGLSQSTLQSLAVGMSNASNTNIVQRLLPAIAIERVPNSQGNVFVRQYIKQEMQNLGWLVEEDTFTNSTPYGPVTFSNVIATFNPAARKRVVIACHYDSKLINRRDPFVAATDSAVPCSIMLDTARQLNQSLANARDSGLSDFSFQFIFFDGEEAFVVWHETDSLYGSRHLAQEWATTPDSNDPRAPNYLSNIRLFVLLDLIGAPHMRIIDHYTNYGSYFSSLVSIEQCLKQSQWSVRSSNQLIFPGTGYRYSIEDDHIPFYRRGVPIVHLIAYPFPAVWHTTQDDLRHLDYDVIDDFSRIFRIFVANLLVTGV